MHLGSWEMAGALFRACAYACSSERLRETGRSLSELLKGLITFGGHGTELQLDALICMQRGEQFASLQA